MKAWDFIKAILTVLHILERVPGWGIVVASLISLGTALVTYFKDAPWFVWAGFGIVSLILLAVLASRKGLELVPSTGQSSEVILTVNNRGAEDVFHAQCEVVNLRNTLKETKKGSYTLRWIESNTSQHSICRGASATLLIAEFALRSHHVQTGEILLPRFNANQQIDYFDDCQWRIENGLLPEYDLKIRITGQKQSVVAEALCILKPQSDTGPLELIMV